VFVDSTRSGQGTVVAAYSPRVRRGLPVSAPVSFDALDDVRPGDVTVTTAQELLGEDDVWAASLPDPQELPADLVAEGHAIPVARVQAMHEGRRRKRAEREAAKD
jgi:DNA primase